MPRIEKNAVVEMEVEDLAYGGLGVGRVNGFVIFVEKVLPGEHVTVRIVKKKQNHAQGALERIDRASPHRIADPPCELFGTCGGCTWQNLAYDQQLVWKQKQVADTLRHVGGQQDFELRPIIASPRIWRYRNKMEFSFGIDRHKTDLVLGFHYPGEYRHILDVAACHLHPEPLDRMLAALRQFAREQQLEAYDQQTHRKFLRHAVMRYSFTTLQCILMLITNEGELPARERLVENLAATVPGFKGFLWGINTGLSDVARIEREAWRWGQPELSETVNGLSFTISPQSFFQTNTAGAELLYHAVEELSELRPDDVVLDAYCGAGSIALHCARAARRVIGIELVQEAIWDARANAALNGIDNATFIAAPLARGLELARHAAGGPFTRVIIDPPRGGMDKRSLRGLIEVDAPVFVYVSCNPATLARDIATLNEAGYRLETVQPVDLFPHTYHIETIVRLRRA